MPGCAHMGRALIRSESTVFLHKHTSVQELETSEWACATVDRVTTAAESWTILTKVQSATLTGRSMHKIDRAREEAVVDLRLSFDQGSLTPLAPLMHSCLK